MGNQIQEEKAQMKEAEVKDKIRKMLNDETSFNDFYNFVKESGIGDWDSINSEEVIKQYIAEKMEEGIHISHIIEAIEQTPSKQELYHIWLGNSSETPIPINTKQDLVEALGVDFE